MTLHRRDLLKGGTALSLAGMLPTVAAAQPAFDPKPQTWRSFQITTRIEIAKPQGKAQAWIPVPSVDAPDWTRPSGNAWTTNAKTATLVRDPKYGAQMLHVAWAETETAPVAEVVSKFTARDRAIDLAKPGEAALLAATDRALYTAPTSLIPTDGIVKETADKITAGKTSELDKVRAIYEWVVDNTFRDAKVRGCGVGDIASMLRTGNLGGKCADINALFVGLARASGIPARDVYGIRVVPSRFGYKSLGAGSEIITKAQHCRAEVYLSGFGWVPMDPADVRKVVLEEPPGNLALTDPKVVAARKTLFGAWETNWLAYNVAHDLVLPDAATPRLEFLMYPQAEVAGSRLDCLDADAFRYTITAKELTAV